MTELNELLEALDPTPAQRRRVRARLDADLEAAETSLVTEWVELFRARPVVHSMYAFSAAALLLLLSPLASLPFVLLR